MDRSASGSNGDAAHSGFVRVVLKQDAVHVKYRTLSRNADWKWPVGTEGMPYRSCNVFYVLILIKFAVRVSVFKIRHFARLATIAPD